MTFTKLPLAIGVVIITLLAVLPEVVVAGWPAKMEKSDLKQMKAVIDGRLAIPSNLTVFVHYNSMGGKRLAKRLAMGNKFKMHLRDEQLVLLTPINGTALEQLVNSPKIAYVEPQHKIHALPLTASEQLGGRTVPQPGDSRAWNQEKVGRKHEFEQTERLGRRLAESVGYGIELVQADKLWDVPSPAKKMTVCVIDSGYALGHPDLPNLSNNVTGTSTNVGDWDMDGYGHGSHCAGIIGALGGNGIGIAGVMKDPNQFKLHISRSLDNEGNGSEEDMLNAFRGCMDAGANVISMSIGSKAFSQTIGDACKNAYDKGVLLVAAAGNDGDTSYSYPASYPEVISVAAIGMTEKVAGFSQYNDQVEIAAPGVDVVSTVPTSNEQSFGYSPWSGTSMATPFVAGVAAAVWSHFPQCTSHQLRQALIRTARANSGAGCTADTGYGVIQAKKAYDLLMSEGCAAGDASPVPLSRGALGGCAQDPSYISPPTSSPTSFACLENVLALELTTDEWPDETSWELTDSDSTVVASGGHYRKNKSYLERFCLPPGTYTFMIKDSEGDGMCCFYGNGGYVITFNDDLIKKGGSFGAEDTATFGDNPNKSPLLHTFTQPTSQTVCQDDEEWTFTNRKGKPKKCKHLKTNPVTRCQHSGTDRYGNVTTGSISCPATCGACSPTTPTSSHSTTFPTKSPTTSPTDMITVAPTAFPTSRPASIHNPTNKPSLTPDITTVAPTPMPSAGPTQSPTSSPTPYPTSRPTSPPTHYTTREQTLNPTQSPTPGIIAVASTPVPSAGPTMLPTMKETDIPTVAPTAPPTVPPTKKPERQPKHSPTSSPTLFPTFRSTSTPTNNHSRKPTLNSTHSQANHQGGINTSELASDQIGGGRPDDPVHPAAAVEHHSDGNCCSADFKTCSENEVKYCKNLGSVCEKLCANWKYHRYINPVETANCRGRRGRHEGSCADDENGCCPGLQCKSVPMLTARGIRTYSVCEQQ